MEDVIKMTTNYEKYFGTPELAADRTDRATNENRDDWDPIGCGNCINFGTHHADPDDEQYECWNCDFKDGILRWLKMEAND